MEPRRRVCPEFLGVQRLRHAHGSFAFSNQLFDVSIRSRCKVIDDESTTPDPEKEGTDSPTGTVLGTGLGISVTYYFQENGISYAEALEEMALTDMVMPNIFYSKVTPDLFYVGLLPGLLATVLGTMLAGLAIYRREMAQLFKELET